MESPSPTPRPAPESTPSRADGAETVTSQLQGSRSAQAAGRSALQSYRRNLQTLSVPSGLESNAHKYVNKAK